MNEFIEVWCSWTPCFLRSKFLSFRWNKLRHIVHSVECEKNCQRNREELHIIVKELLFQRAKRPPAKIETTLFRSTSCIKIGKLRRFTDSDRVPLFIDSLCFASFSPTLQPNITHPQPTLELLNNSENQNASQAMYTKKKK